MSGNNLFFKKLFSTRLFFLILTLIFITLNLFLSSCTGSYMPRPQEANYFEGVRGLEISFLEQTPPDEIYENSSFNINLFIENKGAFDVIGENYGILSISFDPFYIDISALQSTNNVEVSKNGIVVKGIQLPGKSRYYPTGSEAFLSFPTFKTKEIKGQREQPSTQIFTSLCYPYTTTFSHLVCVDLSAYGEQLRTQVCYQQDLSLSDQGAPLAITLVEVENQPAGNELVRPIFTIQVQNKGSGSVLSPAYNSVELERVCSFQNLNREDFNTVEIRAILSNSKELYCNPNPIRLFDGQGFTQCKVPEEDLILGHQNYETPITVTLSYVYLTSISRDIEIKRINIHGGPISPPEQCLPSEIEQGTACISKCYFCNQNPGDGRCQPPNAVYHIKFEEGGFHCQCSDDECNRLYTKGLCVPFSGFCPGASYCCSPECKSSEARIGDKCYPKCSSSKCVEAKNDCACGTLSVGYELISEGMFCCPEQNHGYPDKESCETSCSS